MGFTISEIKILGNYISTLYTNNSELTMNFYDNLMSKNYNECLTTIDNLPSDVKEILSRKTINVDSIIDKIQEVIAYLSREFTIALSHLKELMVTDPEKAKYIMGLGITGMIVSYLLGRRSRV